MSFELLSHAVLIVQSFGFAFCFVLAVTSSLNGIVSNQETSKDKPAWPQPTASEIPVDSFWWAVKFSIYNSTVNVVHGFMLGCVYTSSYLHACKDLVLHCMLFSVTPALTH